MKTTWFSLLIVVVSIVFLLLVPDISFAQNSPHTVRLIYFRPNDRGLQADMDTKLDAMIKDVQRFYADQMEQHGFGRKTFRIETDGRPQAVVHHFTGRHNDSYYHSTPGKVGARPYNRVWDEVRERFDTSQNVYFVAIDTKSGDIGGTTNHVGVATIEGNSGGLVAIPASLSHNHPLAAHELGHTFGLEHDFRSHTHIMSYGPWGWGPAASPSRAARLSKCAAESLDVHPYFNIRRSGQNYRANTTIELLEKAPAPPNAIRFRFKVTDTDGLYQAKLYGSPLNLIACKRLSGTSGIIEFVAPILPKWIPHHTDNEGRKHLSYYGIPIEIHVLDVHGNNSSESYVFSGDLLPPDQVLSVPDVNLASAVRKTLNLSQDDEFTSHQMLRLTVLNIPNQGITDLTGLEYASNLTWLNIGYKYASGEWINSNAVSNLSPIASLTELRDIYLGGNPISDLSPLTKLPNLRTLYLGGNSASDLSPFTKLPNLRTLYLVPNLVLIDMTSLQIPPKVVLMPDANLASVVQETLGLTQDNMITSHSMLGLTQLYAPNRGITDLTGLEYASNLTELWLGSEYVDGKWVNSNAVSNLSPLSTLTHLKRLDLQSNAASDVSALVSILSKLPELTYLDLRYNSISDTSSLSKLTQLTTLYQDQDQDQEPLVVIGEPGFSPIYWISTETGTLHRLTGTKVENVPSVQNATGLALDVINHKLYWTEKTGRKTGRIRRASLDGSNVESVRELNNFPHSIAVDASNGKLYLTNSRGKVQRLNFDGSNYESNLITGLNSPKSVALDVDGGKVYWTESPGSIRRANLDGSNVETFTTTEGDVGGIAITGGKVYWGEKTGKRMGKVSCANLDGSNVETLTTFSGVPLGITVDPVRNRLYLSSSSGKIQCVDLNGENIQDLITNLKMPGHIAIGISSAETRSTDINEDGTVDQNDLLLVIKSLGQSDPTDPRLDVDRDGDVTIADLILVAEAFENTSDAAAPMNGSQVISVDQGTLKFLIRTLQTASDGLLAYQKTLAFLHSLLKVELPNETSLLSNYPNPFNPETWIPYSLATGNDVQILIYDIKGFIIRRLELGYRAAGYYMNKSRAAYWDGRNAHGERVASGIYFYTLKAGNFAATRKMLIWK